MLHLNWKVCVGVVTTSWTFSNMAMGLSDCDAVLGVVDAGLS